MSSQWAVRYSLPQLQAALAPQRPGSIVGTLWDAPPSLALGRYDHIMYWLTRRHVWCLPTWLALQSPDVPWPEERRDRLISSGALDAEVTQQALRAALERYYWADLWWGDGPAPKASSRQLARSLMVARSIPRRRWPRLLGRTATEFENGSTCCWTWTQSATCAPARGVPTGYTSRRPRSRCDDRSN